MHLAGGYFGAMPETRVNLAMQFVLVFSTIFSFAYGMDGAWSGRDKFQPNQLMAPRYSTTNQQAHQMTRVTDGHAPVAPLSRSKSEDSVQRDVEGNEVLSLRDTSQLAPRPPNFPSARASGSAIRPEARQRDGPMARHPGERSPQPQPQSQPVYYLPGRPSFKESKPCEMMTDAEKREFDAFIKRMRPMVSQEFQAAEGLQRHLRNLQSNGSSLNRSTRGLKEMERAKALRARRPARSPVESLIDGMLEEAEARVRFAPEVVSETRYYKLNTDVKSGWLSAEEVAAKEAAEVEKRKCSLLTNIKHKKEAVDADLHGPAENRIVMWGLAKNITCKDILAYFSARPVAHVTLVNNLGSSVNTVFIEFASQKDAEEVVTVESSFDYRQFLAKLGMNVGIDVCPGPFHILERDIHIEPSDPSSPTQQAAIHEMTTANFWRETLPVPLSFFHRRSDLLLRIVVHRAEHIETVKNYAEGKKLKVTLFKF